MAVLLALALCSVTMAGPGGPAFQSQRRPKGPALSAYLLKHPWDVARRGAMLAVDPDSAIAADDGDRLESFGRQEFKVGSVTAIAPREMVTIDTTFKDAPNMYQGLKREDKVIYLMSLLDNEQWELACTRGIGLSDLRGEAQAVYRSILPSTFSYDAYQPNQPPNPIALSQSEESDVRIRFYKQLMLGVRLADENGFTDIGTGGADEPLGGTVGRRRNESAEDRDSAFGVQIRKILPNGQKPSDIDCKAARFDPPLTLTPATTVAGLCQAASAASGAKLVADVRIRDLAVTTLGPAARTGDVLQALALSVAGTWRKVGDTYLLTYDLEGIGTKRLRLAFWMWDLQALVGKREREWKSAVKAGGGARFVGFRPNSPLLPNDAMNRYIASERDNQGVSRFMSASSLTPEWRAVFMEGVTRAAQNNQPIRSDIVDPSEQLYWNFMLPQGGALAWEGSLTLNDILGTPGAGYTPNQPPPVKAMSIGTSDVLVYRTDDVAISALLAGYAKRHGFEEIWLQTWQPKCLSEAIRAAKENGLRVRLVVKPWESPLPSSSGTVDQTLLGMGRPEATKLHDGTVWWAETQWDMGMTPRSTPNVISPADASRETNWNRLAALSKAPGLDGCVITDTEPRGYEPQITDLQYAPMEMMFIMDLGYDEALRSQYLTDYGFDPVDIVDTRLRIQNPNLTLPFFGDPRKFGEGGLFAEQPPGSIEKWMALRNRKNLELTKQFLGLLTGPILLEPRQRLCDMPADYSDAVLPYTPSQELPTYGDEVYHKDPAPVPGGFRRWQFGYPGDSYIDSVLLSHLSKHMADHAAYTAFDVSSVPADKLPDFLDKWFALREARRSPDPQK